MKLIKCVVCGKFADRIRGKKGLSQTWVDGIDSIKRDSLEKQVKGEPDQFTESLALKEFLDPSYYEKVVSNTPFGGGLTEMQKEDK